MKKLFFLLMFVPFCSPAQKAQDILERIGMIQFMIENPGGQMMYRQTKDWCTDFLQYNEFQAPVMDELFNSQYIDIALAYKKYSQSHSPAELKTLINVIVKQEHYFRQLLTPKQMELYKAKFLETAADRSSQKNKAFHTLFISDEALRYYENED